MNGCVSKTCQVELTRLQLEARDPNYEGDLAYEWVHCDAPECHVFVHANDFASCEECDAVLCQMHRTNGIYCKVMCYDRKKNLDGMPS